MNGLYIGEASDGANRSSQGKPRPSNQPENQCQINKRWKQTAAYEDRTLACDTYAKPVSSEYAGSEKLNLGLPLF